jgi:hypothetical protein
MYPGVFVVAEEVTPHVTPRCLIGVEAHEAHQTAAARVDLGARDRLPQIVGLALPLIRVEPDAFLRFVIICEGERGKLVKRDRVLAQQGEQFRGGAGELHATFHVIGAAEKRAAI